MKTRRVFAWLLVLAVLAAVVPARRWLAVDRCLDAGGVFDAAQTHCRHDIDTLPASAADATVR